MDMKSYALGALLALVAMQPAVAQTYRCQLAGGVVSYQQTPCALPELAEPLAAPQVPPKPAAATGAPAPAPAAATAPATAPAPALSPAQAAAPAPRKPAAPAPASAGRDTDDSFAKLTRRMREVLDLTARLERCRIDQPGFAARTGEVYQAWRRRHAPTLSEYRKLLAIKVRAAGRVDAAACSDEWVKEVEALARTPDARFATVEQTWEVFVAALQAADRPTIMNCVTGPVALAMKERLEQLADADLRRMGVNIRGLKVQWGDDYDKEGMVLHGDRVDAIAFRSINEEWKIRLLAPAPGPAPGQTAMPKRSSPDS